MPEEWRMPVVDPRPSRAATVSGSDGPKSTGRKAISTQLSLEGWCRYAPRYARYWPWPRGRSGRSRGRRGTSAVEIGQSISRISGPRRRRQRSWDHSPDMDDEGELAPPELARGLLPLRWLRPMATEELRVEEGPVEEHVAGKADGSIVTEEPIPAEGIVEEPGKADSEIALAKAGMEETVASKTGGSIITEEAILAVAEVAVEYSVAGKTVAEIALAKKGMEEPVASETGGSVITEEPILADVAVEYSMAGKTVGEIAAEDSKPQEGTLEKPPVKTDAEIALAKRWLPSRYPAFPSSGKFEDFLKYTEESKMICKRNKAGYERTKNLPTWEVESHQETKASVKFEERDIYLKAGESVVAVASSGPGHDNTCFCCGVIISCDEDGVGTIRILTSSGILYDDKDVLRSPEQKVSVKLPNRLVCSGDILYVNRHYNIAILKVRVLSSVAALGFGSMPRYGQRVIALGRDSIELFTRDGSISTLERTILERTHYMFLESAQKGFPVICTGGPVIDENGAMVGIIACHVPETAMMSISIVQICLDLWNKYRCIARPEISMYLRTVQRLTVEKRDLLKCVYNIRSGFVIDGVKYDSTPEKVGIRRGDVMEIVDEQCGSTLPELEAYLLEHGSRFLHEMEGGTLTKELKLKIRVNDLVEGSSTDTHLCIPVVYDMALP